MLSSMTGRIVSRTIGLLLMLVLCSSTEVIAQEFISDHWTTKEGLPINILNDVIQDDLGYIWIASNDGLIRFDGLQFEVFNSVNTPDMQSNRVQLIEKDKDGNLIWLTDQGHVVKYFEGAFRHLNSAMGLPGDIATSIKLSEQGRIWIGTSSGLAYLEGESVVAIATPYASGPVHPLYIQSERSYWILSESDRSIYHVQDGVAVKIMDIQGAFYYCQIYALSEERLAIADKGGLWFYENGRLTNASFGLPEEVVVTSMHVRSNGTIRLLTGERGMYEYDEQKQRWNKLREAFGLVYNRESMFTAASGDVWDITRFELYINDKPVPGLPASIVYTGFVMDQERNLWLTTASQGLFRLRKSSFRTYGTNEGIASPNFYPIVVSRDSTVWGGRADLGPASVKGAKVESDYTLSDPSLLRNKANTILELKKGTLLHAGYGPGIYTLDRTTRVSTITHTLPLGEFPVYFALFEDSRERVWAGTRTGVFILDGGEWTHILSDPRFHTNYVRQFIEAPDGSIWMGTNGQGVLRWYDGTFSELNEENGLVSNNIRSFYLPPESGANTYTLWVGSEDKGLQILRFNHNQSKPVNSKFVQVKDGLYDNVIHSMVPDNYGRVWVNTNRGIFWVNRDEMDQFVAGGVPEVTSTFYTEQDGLINKEGNGGFQSAGTGHPDGSIWLPSQAGMVRIETAQIGLNTTVPMPVIEKLTTADSTRFIFTERVELDKENRDIELFFTGLSLAVPEKIEFRYKLEGEDEDWTTTKRRLVTYNNLSQGTYTFKLYASNSEGFWSEQPRELVIVIPPKFYETYWFIGILVLGFIAGVYGLVETRTRVLRRREAELEEEIRKRTNELIEEKKITEQQAKELQELDEAKSRFYTNITHEFKTPLTLIMGPVNKLMKDDSLPTEARESHKLIYKHSQLLLRLINQILDISKLEAGELTMNDKQEDLVEFIEEIVELFKPLCKEKGLRIEFSTSRHELPFIFDAEKYEQMISNLLSNAVKFTLRGGSVSLELKDDTNSITLSIADTGIGIPQELQQQVFDRFYQVETAASDTKYGSGIGLALVKELVKANKGTIELESEPGKGSIFIIKLPKKSLVPGESKEYGRSPVHVPTDEYEEQPAEVSEIEQTKPTILVADDHNDMRRFVISCLTDDYNVIEAQNGEEALELCKEQLPDLAILDVMMPKMDGFELGKRLQEDPVLSGIPVVYLTAKGNPDARHQGLDAGAVAYITKPFDPHLLNKQIENLVNQQLQLRNQFQKLSPVKDAPTHPFEASVVEILKQEFMNSDFGVSQLADALHLDRSQLFRNLKDCCEVSPSKYMLNFRLTQAAESLAKKEGSVSQIAYACGFNNLSYFSKCFNERFGIKPSDYVGKEVNR